MGAISLMCMNAPKRQQDQSGEMTEEHMQIMIMLIGSFFLGWATHGWIIGS